MPEWWSIKVFHGEFSARRWQDTCSSALIEAAMPGTPAGACATGLTPPGLPKSAQAGTL
jgi:hypothetical protein